MEAIDPALDTQSYNRPKPPTFPLNPSARLPHSSNQHSPAQPYYSLPVTPGSHQSSAVAALEAAQQQSPGDGADGTDSYDGEADINGGSAADAANDPKRSRACEACRGLKVRCDQDPDNPDRPCKRCAKANRPCVITAPSRKRQKKTDNRVAELERKIDALTATLHAQKAEGHADEGYATQHGYLQSTGQAYGDPRQPYPIEQGMSPGVNSPHYPAPQASMYPHQGTTQSQYGQKRRRPGESDSRTASVARDERSRQHAKGTGNPSAAGNAGTAAWAVNTSGGHAEARRQIDQLLDQATVERIFLRYTDMAVHMPAVVFPRNTTVAVVRESKPILLLAILSAASVGMTDLRTQRELTKAMLGIFADCIIRSGEKSLELVQSLQISTLWYRPPDCYEHMNFYQFVHIASVMAIDLGMGKRYKTANSQFISWAERGARSAQSFESLEYRRIWLGCYFLAANVSMSMRRPNLIRWTAYMDECLEVLESFPDSLPSDKVLCQHVRIQHVCEDIGSQFSMDDPSATIAISDPKVQYAIKVFENQLREWRAQVPKKLTSRESANLTFSEHVTGLYIHEVALHVNHNVDDFRAPFTEESLSNNGNAGDILTPAHISALSECLTSVHGILNTFLSFELDIIRTLPIFYFVRVAYAVVVLIKMYFAVAAPGSEIGKIISKDDLRVESHLDSLLTLFRTSADEGSFRPATKFLFILSKLREWFQKHRDGKTGSRTSGGGASPEHKAAQLQHQQRQQQPRLPQQQYGNGMHGTGLAGYQGANTPLHLLSEVAMGDSNGAASRQAHLGRREQAVNTASSTNWYPSMATPAQQHIATPGPMDISAITADATINYGQSPGGVFEQAMDLTLANADGDFSNIFQGDGLFNFSLDGAGNIFQNWNWG